MKSYVFSQLLLIVIVGANYPLLEPTDRPTSTTLNKLVLVYDGSKGTEEVEIYDKDIPRANLSTLTDWLFWTDNLKSFLFKLKENSHRCEVHCLVSGENNEDISIHEKLEQSIKTVEEYERKMESELRKPEKDWNYSIEKKTLSYTNTSEEECL